MVVNKSKIKGQIPLKYIFGFCKTFKKITKNLGFRLTLETNDLQKTIFTTIATDINVTINSIYLFVPILIPNTETQVMFNDTTKDNYTITYDSWYTERKLSVDGNELQVNIGSAQHVNSPKYLIASFQTADRIAARNKNKNIAIFDNVKFENNFVKSTDIVTREISVLTNVPENDCLDQYRDLKLIYKEYDGEELMNPFISYTDMKNKYPVQVIDSRHQVDHITPKKFQLFEEFNTDRPKVNATLFVILVTHRQIEMISDGDKYIESKVI